jgi:hypothetical protein
LKKKKITVLNKFIFYAWVRESEKEVQRSSHLIRVGVDSTLY